MTCRTGFGMAVVCAAMIAPAVLQAQSITGYSAIFETGLCPPGSTPQPPGTHPSPYISFPIGHGPVTCTLANSTNLSAETESETEEDYTAALYYDVQTATSEYYNIQSSPVASQTTAPTNGGASTLMSYEYPGANADGIYSEDTLHYLNFFYVTTGGGYYDPYGYSGIVNGQGDGNYGDGFWYYVTVIGIYVGEASVVLGQTIGAMNHNSIHPTNPNTPSARSYSVLMQTFIPGNNAEAPYKPPPFCGATQYDSLPIGWFQGDNRAANPDLGSYRSFQQVTLGLGGVTPPTTGVQDTGYTHLFAQDAITNGVISQAALQDRTQGDCHYLIYLDKASTSGMTRPQANGSGGSSASTTLQGSAGNPLTPSGAIQWNAQITLTQSSPTTVSVSGTMLHKCFPAYELSVAGTDVDYQPPTSSNFFTIATCLAGFGEVTESFSTQLIIAP